MKQNKRMTKDEIKRLIEDKSWDKIVEIGSPAIDLLCEHISSTDYSIYDYYVSYDLNPVYALKELRNIRDISTKEYKKIDKTLESVVKGLVELLHKNELYENEENDRLDPGYLDWMLFFWDHCHRILTDLGKIGGPLAVKALKDFTGIQLVEGGKKIYIEFGPNYVDCSNDTWEIISNARETANLSLKKK